MTRNVSRLWPAVPRRVQSNTPFATLTNNEGTMTDQDTMVQRPAEQAPVTLFGLPWLAVRARDSSTAQRWILW
jgi:hypothetical protein